MRIKSFQGLYPLPELVHEVACVPYDVVNRQESAALAEDHPYSLLHVDRAEIDLPPETDPYAPEVYARARENFLQLQKAGVLGRESEPCLYVYRLRMNAHVQTGVATVCHIDDYEGDVIKKHEKTRRDKEEDRTRLIGQLRANTGPVFLTYRKSPLVDAEIARVQQGVPLYQFTAADDVEHTVWRVTGAEKLRGAFAAIPCAYVADGHHRTASAARVGRELRAANPQHNGSEEYNWFLSVLFPGDQLQILPYNRAVRDLNAHTGESFLREVSQVFQLRPSASPKPTGPGDIRMYFAGAWHQLTWTSTPATDPIAQLDVSVLQDRLLATILDIDDPRTSKRIDFIGGIRGTDELVRLVDEGRAAVAFSMFPTTVEQLMAIADAGQIMPPKSTWFEPKLRSGLFIHTF